MKLAIIIPIPRSLTCTHARTPLALLLLFCEDVMNESLLHNLFRLQYFLLNPLAFSAREQLQHLPFL